MKLLEYQGKELFRKQGMPVPRGVVATTPQEVEDAARGMGRVVVKAQVQAGGRGKAGGVKVASTPEEARAVAEQILGMEIKGLTVHKVLVEPALNIDKEYYAGIVNDRSSKRFVLMLSAMGGVDIEDVAVTDPEKIVKIPLDPAFGTPDYLLREAVYDAGFDAASHPALIAVLRQLYAASVAEDALLVEINPLAITAEGQVVVADAKVDIDDNALYRHPELAEYREESFDNEMDRQAAEQGLTYVHLGGNVGIIGNGAGLVMTTLDVVNANGLKPANFLDIGGGAQAAQVIKALTMVLSDPEVKAVIFNIFGGITRADEVARGMLDAAEGMTIPVPVVVRLSGTEQEAGRKLLEGSQYIIVDDVQEAAQRVRELIGASASANGVS